MSGSPYFQSMLLVFSVCSLLTSRAADRNVWGRASSRTWDLNGAEIWKSLHSASAVQNCMKAYGIIYAHGRGLAGSALQTELRLQVRNK